MELRVVDASAIAAILYAEPEADAVADWLEGKRMVAPSLIGYVLASVYQKKAASYPEQRSALLTALRCYPQLGVEEVRVAPDAAAVLAEETGLTAYDAAYLWLARHLATPLVTLDRRLRALAG